VLGLSGVPSAGDTLTVVESEARAREVAAYRQSLLDRKRTTSARSAGEYVRHQIERNDRIPAGHQGDVQGSAEAIAAAVNRISTEDIRAPHPPFGSGGITESDVTLAAASGRRSSASTCVPIAKAREIAERNKVEFRYYDVIYHLTDWVKQAMAGELGPEIIETVVGRAEVREVFPRARRTRPPACSCSKASSARGSMRASPREDVIVSKTTISSLRRFKDDVPQVIAGLECGALLADTNDIKPGDMLELFEVEERARTL
jgi:translation initiation factor IF-2